MNLQSPLYSCSFTDQNRNLFNSHQNGRNSQPKHATCACMESTKTELVCLYKTNKSTNQILLVCFATGGLAQGFYDSKCCETLCSRQNSAAMLVLVLFSLWLISHLQYPSFFFHTMTIVERAKLQNHTITSHGTIVFRKIHLQRLESVGCNVSGKEDGRNLIPLGDVLITSTFCMRPSSLDEKINRSLVHIGHDDSM
jgi:hypothetical protein